MKSVQQTTTHILPMQLHQNPIAIVGMASVFPKSPNLHEYWDNIMHEVDCLTEVPSSRWQWEDYYDPDPNTPDKTYCKQGGFIPEIDFNPLEFGLRPNILELTDVSQLISLVVAREALKDAGYSQMNDAQRLNTGVILGVGGGQKLQAPLIARLQYPIWERVLRNSGVAEADVAKITEKIKKAYIPWEENSFPGMLGNVIAGRIANRFDLGGINCVVDAACAASLAATRMAVSELAAGRTDMMITGGVDTDNSIFMYMCFSKTPAFSRSQQARPFDAQSDGMVVGEGIGMLVLKRLADAERDGDRIYAVIRGLGASSDGRYKSIYAPRPDGQALALKRAYEDAGVELSTVGLIEAHGTGTVAGDLCEFTTLAKVFSEEDAKKQHIALGSVKSQIGHTKAAAGSASLIKAALALHHKVLPPTINVTEPNPKYDVENSPFYLNTTARPWMRHENQSPRRAGVSSFGFGGTNYHVVLEEYQPDHSGAYRLHQAPQIIVMAAPSPAQLLARAEAALGQLQGDKALAQFYELADTSRKLVIPTDHARLGFVADSVAAALNLLQMAVNMLKNKPQAAEWTHPKGIYYRQKGQEIKGKVVALFSGQGSQYLNMGRELAINFPLVRQVFGALDKQFAAGASTIADIVYPFPTFNEATRAEQAETLQNTEFAQPAIGALSVSLYKILQQAGFNADFTAGHSFGELTALWAAEVLTDADYLRLVKARGEAMSHRNAPFNADSGTMLAVTGNIEALQRELTAFPEITLANHNSREQVVLAGTKAQVAQVQSYLKGKGYSTVLLPVSAAFHTHLVGHAQRPFAQAIKETTFHAPQCAVFSNTTGQRYPTTPTAIQQTLSEQLLKPVRFKDEIENIYQAGGTIFIEFGPRNILTNLVKNILGDKPHLAVALNGSRQKDSDRQLRDAVAQLRVVGLPLGDIDPYQIRPELVVAQPSAINVPMTGHNYVSPARIADYESSLNDGFRIGATTSAPQIAAPVIPVAVAEPKPETPSQAAPKEIAIQPIVTPERPMIKPVVIPAPASNGRPVHPALHLRQSLEQFQCHQQEMAQAHAEYLQNQAEYSQTFFSLTQQLDHLMQKANGKGLSDPHLTTAFENLGQSLKQFQTYQLETVTVHEQYLQHQGQYADSFLNLLNQQSATMRLDFAPPIKNEFVPVAPIEQPAVSETAYPAVEAKVIPAADPRPVTIEPVTVQAPPPAPADNPLTQVMLAVVSEKTGYPSDMLSLEMDMEADLGIDSINRVEILAGVQERYPGLPKINPEELAELRTLQEIVNFIGKGVNGQQVKAESLPVVQKQHTPTPTASPQAVTPAPATDKTQLTQVMLAVVSEKTGYPSDMLSLEMDMEADLGIDSINRVEILAGVQERYPGLPKINPEELAELRTLQEIVNFIGKGVNGQQVKVESLPVAQKQHTPAASPQPATPAPAPAPATDKTQLTQVMLAVVSEKTGYPSDMLSLEMDMEADLGIDSINRVEILAGVQERYPGLPKINPEELAELRTLQEIVNFIGKGVNGQQVKVESLPVVQKQHTPTASPQPATPAPATDKTQLTQVMLAVVSEKTGYPSDMLSLEMDMEADLGIDSINRVEILAGVQERYPGLPKINPEELAELRTLQEIVNFIGKGVNGQQVKVESLPVVQKQHTPTPTASPQPATPAPAATDKTQLTQVMLAVVSEKTGYPSDMLSLEMDMEADLGIDSINRVEILAGVQERYPGLPKINPEELAELRTLQEIVNFIGKGVNGQQVKVESLPVAQKQDTPTAAPQPAAPAPDKSAFTTHELSEKLLQVVSEKTGYPINMLSLEMDMEADLGIDSINRVEILAGLQDHFPNIPKINPESLADLCRLKEIVDYIQNNASSEQPNAPAKPQAILETPPAVTSSKLQAGADYQQLTQVMLAVVSEKTGYPSDMLSLEMDMEADLGIDSINRVEILAGVQERYPGLPKINPEELAELRTLQQIIQHIGQPAPQVNGKNGLHKEPTAPLLKQSEVKETVIAEEPLPPHSIIRSTVRLKSLPAPDFMAFDLPAGQVCVLTNDGSAASKQVARTLQAQGLKVVVLSFPTYVVPAQNHWDMPHVSLNDLSEAHLQQQLTTIAQQYGTIGAFIHLSPTREASLAKGIYFSEAEKALAKHIFLIAKHIKKNITENAGRFMTVARLDGTLGTQSSLGISVIDGSLFGLTKTLTQEWPTVHCRALDLSPTMSAEQVAQTVWAELHDPNRLVVEVGHGAQGRVTLAISNG